jgi:hypothetical protein
MRFAAEIQLPDVAHISILTIFFILLLCSPHSSQYSVQNTQIVLTSHPFSLFLPHRMIFFFLQGLVCQTNISLSNASLRSWDVCADSSAQSAVAATCFSIASNSFSCPHGTCQPYQYACSVTCDGNRFQMVCRKPLSGSSVENCQLSGDLDVNSFSGAWRPGSCWVSCTTRSPSE